MSPRFLRLGAAVLLATLCTGAPGAAAPDVPQFEVDIIFPRSETYTTTDTFPIVVALQNITAAGTLGEFDFFWVISPYSEGTLNSIAYDQNNFFGAYAEEDGTRIFVANTNVTGWIDKKERGDRFQLTWGVNWYDNTVRCPSPDTHVTGSLLFGIEAPGEDALGWEDAGQGVAPDIMKVPECPTQGSVVEIRPNPANSSCPLVVAEDPGKGSNPCRVKVNEDIASRIASHGANSPTSVLIITVSEPDSTSTTTGEPEETQMTTGEPEPTPTTTDEPEPTKNAAGGVSSTVRTAVVACALGCLALVS